MKGCNAEPFKNRLNKGKGLAFLQVLVELMTRFELVTSSLPME